MAFKIGMTVDFCMTYNADARFDDLDLDTRSQWIGRRKQYLSYGIETAHDGRLMHGIYMLMFVSMTMTVSLALKEKNVCKTRPACFYFEKQNKQRNAKL